MKGETLVISSLVIAVIAMAVAGIAVTGAVSWSSGGKTDNTPCARVCTDMCITGASLPTSNVGELMVDDCVTQCLQARCNQNVRGGQCDAYSADDCCNVFAENDPDCKTQVTLSTAGGIPAPIEIDVGQTIQITIEGSTSDAWTGQLKQNTLGWGTFTLPQALPAAGDTGSVTWVSTIGGRIALTAAGSGIQAGPQFQADYTPTWMGTNRLYLSVSDPTNVVNVVDIIATCPPGAVEICGDGIDNDCNSLIDEYDPVCGGEACCIQLSPRTSECMSTAAGECASIGGTLYPDMNTCWSNCF